MRKMAVETSRPPPRADRDAAAKASIVQVPGLICKEGILSMFKRCQPLTTCNLLPDKHTKYSCISVGKSKDFAVSLYTYAGLLPDLYV